MATNSFALTDGGVVLQQPTQAVTGPQITLQGGGGNAPPVATPGLAPGGEFQQFGQQAGDLTGKALDALNKMTQGALQPYVEAQQKKAYFDGMSQVVQGKALQDIEREQPWYTKIFGPSATVQGAQAITAITATSQAQSEFMEAMPELRKQGPDAVRKFLVDQAVRVGNTGDVLVDGIVQQKLAEQWGPMLSTHMKQHYAWQQEDMGNKFVTMQVANGKLLQGTLTNQANYDSPQQMQLEVDKFNAGLARPAGMSDESYGKYMALSAQSQLNNGTFEAYQAMKQNPEVWNAIPPQSRMALEKSEELWAARALRDSPALVGIMNDKSRFTLAVTQGVFPGSETDLNTAIDKFNSDFKAQTGSTSDMINNVERGKLIQHFYHAKMVTAGAYEKAQQGLLDDQAQRASVMRAYNGGTSSLMPPGVSESNAQAAAEEFWSAALQSPNGIDNAISKLALTSDEKKLRPPSLESQLRQDAQALFAVGGNITERQQNSLGVMQKILSVPGGGPAALSNYIGADEAVKVKAFLNSGVDLNDPKSVEETRKWLKDGSGAHSSKEDRDAAKNYISSQDPGWFSRYVLHTATFGMAGGPGELTEYELNAPTQARLAEELATYVATTKKAYPGMKEDDAAQFAFAKLYGNPKNVDFVDGTLVKKEPYLPGAQSLFSGVQKAAGFQLSQADANYQSAVRDTLRGTLKSGIAAITENVKGDSLKDSKMTIDHFRDDDYVAVGGQQMQGGSLMMTYRNTKTYRTIPVIVTPGDVLEHLKKNMNKPKLNADLQTMQDNVAVQRTGIPAY